MNGRPVTDAQISQALRAHLPERAQPGLRARVLDATRTTSQQRSLPSFLGALGDADPVNRRRNLLIAAALLVALAFASVAAAGAWRLLQRDPIDKLSLEPPADVPAFVLSSYERLPELPPVALTWRDSDSTKGRIYVDRSGAVRFDRFPSADATEPSGYRILSPNHRISGVATVDSEAVWVEQGHEAIDVPREYIRGVLSAGETAPGCEMERDSSEVGTGTAATGWRYIGLEYVAGRPTHHVACVGDLWIDIETRLILRTQGPAVDDAGQPIPVEFTEVTEIAFGEQPAALFEPPDGPARISAEEYTAYICARDLPNEMAPGISDCPTTGDAEATPLPTATPIPTVRPSLGPRPGGPAGPLAWTPANLKEDWPAPVRPEPARASSVQPIPLTHMDPTGDTGSDIDPWIDIRGVMGDTRIVHLNLVSNQPPVVDPAELWIAYGVVTDDDRDGVPDWRYGIDNMPVDAGNPPNRGWRTNLHTGQTDAGREHEDPVWSAYRGAPKAWFPSGSSAGFRFYKDLETTQGPGRLGFELDVPFYTWASVIVNGRVVATDYAPDTGWLIATPGAKPGGTYLLDDSRLPIGLSVSVPNGWTADGSDLVYAGAGDDEIGRLQFMNVDPDDPPTWSCDPKGYVTAAHFGPTVDDLVTFLAGVQTIKISVNTDVTLDGHRGRYLEITPTSADGCGGEPDFTRAWIIDVDGVRLLIGASSASSTETVMAELQQMVDSIQIEP